MSKYRQATKVDSNQTEIVEALRELDCYVQLGYDDKYSNTWSTCFV